MLNELLEAGENVNHDTLGLLLLLDAVLFEIPLMKVIVLGQISLIAPLLNDINVVLSFTEINKLDDVGGGELAHDGYLAHE